MVTELSLWKKFAVALFLGLFVLSLGAEDAEARGRGRRGRGGVARRGNAKRINARRGPRRGAGQRRAGGGRRGRGIQAAPSLAGNNNQGINDFGPASNVPPDLFGGIGGIGNDGGIGVFGNDPFGGVQDPSQGGLRNAGVGNIQVIDGFQNLAFNGRGDFFQVDPKLIAQGRSAAQAVVQPMVGFNGKIIAGRNAAVDAETDAQIRAFNAGEIPVRSSAGSSQVAAGRSGRPRADSL